MSLKIGPPPPPQGYLALAKDLANGLVPLESAGISGATALAFLGAQAVETALKAYLLSRGRTEEELKHPDIRHDIERLWVEARREGLPIAEAPSGFIAHFAAMHKKPFPLRYAHKSAIRLIVAGPASAEVLQLLSTIESAMA
jgi:hypothetical protein